MRSHLKAGKVYRLEQLNAYFDNLPEELNKMLEAGTIKKLETDLYYIPKKTVFGEVPPDRKEMIKAFLNDDNFLIMSPNNYNALGVGTTQLYNKAVVYNHKQHGKFMLDGKSIEFKITGFPKTLTKEFLLVDLINNIDSLAEDTDSIKEKVKRKFPEFNKSRMKRLVKSFGENKTKKFFEELLKEL
jgi:hypothetical protein